MTDDSFEKSIGDLFKPKGKGENQTGGQTDGAEAPQTGAGNTDTQEKGILGRAIGKAKNFFNGGGEGAGKDKESEIKIKASNENPTDKGANPVGGTGEGTGVPPAGAEQSGEKQDNPENVPTDTESVQSEGTDSIDGTATGESGQNNVKEKDVATDTNEQNGGADAGGVGKEGSDEMSVGGWATKKQVADAIEADKKRREEEAEEKAGEEAEEKARKEAEEKQTADDLRNKYIASKAKAFLSSLPVEDASSVADTYFRGARTLVNAMLLHPHAISSASRILGTAFATAEATGRLATNTAKKYSRVADKDPEIVKNTVMYKLYRRKQDQDKVAIENAYKTMDDALKQAGVDDYRQMTGDQLVDYLDVLGKSRDSMAETLKKGTNPDGTPTSREDRWLLKSQLDIVSEHADKVYKQYNRISPYERRMDAEQTRQANARMRADKQAQRLAEKQAKIDAKNAEKQFEQDWQANEDKRWAEAKKKTGYEDILGRAFDKPTDLTYNGMPASLKDANHLHRYVTNRIGELTQALDNQILQGDKAQKANYELNRLKKYQNEVLSKDNRFADKYGKLDAKQTKDLERQRIAGTVENLSTTNQAVYNVLKNVYGNAPKEVDKNGIPVNVNDRTGLFSKLSRLHREGYNVPEDYLLSLASSIGPNALEKLEGRIAKQKLDDAIRQSRENLTGNVRKWVESLAQDPSSNSVIKKIYFDADGVPTGGESQCESLINALKKNPSIIPDLEDRCEYMMKVAGDNRNLKQNVKNYYIDQCRRDSNINNYEYNPYEDVLNFISEDGDIDVNAEGCVAPSSFNKLKSKLEDLIGAYSSIDNGDPKLREYCEQALEYFTETNKILTDKAETLGRQYGEVFEYIARVSPGFSKNKIDEINRNNNWGSAQAHTQIMKAVSSYIDRLLENADGFDKNGNPKFNDDNVAKNYKIAMAVQRAINLSDIKDDFTNTVRSYMRRYGWLFNTDSGEGKELLAKADAAYNKWMGPFGLNNLQEFGAYGKDAFPMKYPVQISRVITRGKNKGQLVTKTKYVARSTAENAYKDELAAILKDFLESKMPKDDAEAVTDDFKKDSGKKLRGNSRGKDKGKGKTPENVLKDPDVVDKVLEAVKPKLNPEVPEENPSVETGEEGGAGEDGTGDVPPKEEVKTEESGTGGEGTGVPKNKLPKVNDTNYKNIYKNIIKDYLNNDGNLREESEDELKTKLKEMYYLRVRDGNKYKSTELTDDVLNEVISSIKSKIESEKDNIEKNKLKEEVPLSNQEVMSRISSARKEGWLRGQKDKNQFNIYVNRADSKFLAGLGKELGINSLTDEKSVKDALSKHFGLAPNQIKFADDLNNIKRKGRWTPRTPKETIGKDGQPIVTETLGEATPQDEAAKQAEVEEKNLKEDENQLTDANNNEHMYNIVADVLDGIDNRIIRNISGINRAKTPTDIVRFALLYYFGSPNYKPKSEFLNRFKNKIQDALRDGKPIFDGEDGEKYREFFEDKVKSVEKDLRELYWVKGESDGSKKLLSDADIIKNFKSPQSEINNADGYNRKMSIFRELSRDDGTLYPDISQEEIDKRVKNKEIKAQNEKLAEDNKHRFSRIRKQVNENTLNPAPKKGKVFEEEYDDRYDDIKNKYGTIPGFDFDYVRTNDYKLTQKEISEYFEKYYEDVLNDIESNAIPDDGETYAIKEAMKRMRGDKKNGLFEDDNDGNDEELQKEAIDIGGINLRDLPSREYVERTYPGRHIITSNKNGRFDWNKSYSITTNGRPYFREEYLNDNDILNVFLRNTGLNNRDFYDKHNKNIIAQDVLNQIEQLGEPINELSKEDYEVAMKNTQDAIRKLWNSNINDRGIAGMLDTKIKTGSATTYGDLIKSKKYSLKDVVENMLFHADLDNRDKALKLGNLREDTYQTARNYFEDYESPSVNYNWVAQNTPEFLEVLYDEYIKNPNNEGFDKYVRDYIQARETEKKSTNTVKKSTTDSVDGFLFEAWSKHDGSYEKLTSLLSPDSFAKGGLMASAKSLDDMYDIILHNVGSECAESFGRHFIV